MIILEADAWVKSNVAKPPVARWTGKTGFQTARLHQINDPFFAY